MRDALFVAGRDLRYMLRQRETLMWVFVMPILFFGFIGSVTGQFGGGGDGPTPIALVAPEGAGLLADEIALRLGENDYRVDRFVTREETEGRTRRLTLPPALTDSVLAGVATDVWFESPSSALAGDYDRVRTGRAVYTVLADVIALGTADSAAAFTAARFAELRERPRALKLEVSTAGKRLEPPSGYEQAVPGTMVMFTLLVMATSGSILLVIERRQGLLRRLASTPIPVGAVVVGKWAGRLALGLVQIAFAMIVGSLPFFGVDWGPNLPAVLAVMFVYGALMAALGMVLGTVARTEGQAIAVGVVSANVLGALGGCWWPIEITPPWMQKLALFLPTGWAMDALHALVNFVAPASTVVPHVAGMALGTVLLLAWTTRYFRFH